MNNSFINQVPPPIQVKKKNTAKKLFRIILFSLLGIFVFCIAFGIIFSNTPAGKAANTQEAINRTATASVLQLTPNSGRTNSSWFYLIDSTQSAETNMPTNVLTETPTLTLVITPTVELSTLTYQEIVNKSNYLTQAQWKEYTQEISGQRIHWTGYVNDVSEHSFLGSTWYDVDICMISYPCVQDAVFTYPKEISLQLNKGQKITFEGDLDLSGVDNKDAFLFRVIVNLENPIIISNKK